MRVLKHDHIQKWRHYRFSIAKIMRVLKLIDEGNKMSLGFSIAKIMRVLKLL